MATCELNGVSADGPPEIDPEHSHAEWHAMAVKLWQNEHTRRGGIRVLWKLLDDTPSMINVHRWLLEQPGNT